MVFALILVGMAGSILYHREIEKECTKAGAAITYARGFSELPLFWKFSFPSFLSSTLTVPVLWLANSFLVHIPRGYGELGMINAYSQWKNLLVYLPSILALVALPAISSAIGKETADPDGTEYNFEMANAMNQVILWPLAILLMFGSKFFMGVYGLDFGIRKTLFIVMIGGTAIGYIGSSMNSLAISKGMVWLGVLQNSLWGLILLAITYGGVNTYGAMAIVGGTAVAYFVLLSLSTLYLSLKNMLPAGFALRILFGEIIMAVLMAGAIMTPMTLSLIIAVPLAAASVPLVLISLTSRDIQKNLKGRLTVLSRKLQGTSDETSL
jgi:O-antigen/teichoic acid export membrane protein